MSTGSKVTGTVVRFLRGRGFGFIKPEDGGKEVFVHWEDVVTDDRAPFIEKDTEVEYLTSEENGKCVAKEVTLAGGAKIPVFAYADREVNKNKIFLGSVKFFDGWKGFGFIKPDEEISWQDTNSGKGIFFGREALIGTDMSKNMDVKVSKDMRVSFRVYKDSKGLGACEVQNEDQSPLESEPRAEWKGESKKRKRKKSGGKKKKSKKLKKEKTKAKTKEELIEEREMEEGENVYTGIVKFYKADKEYGFINIEEEINFKDVTVKGKIYVMKEDIVCYSDEVGLTPKSEVMFKIYKDSKGIGACEVMNVDGTPVQYQPQVKEAEAEKEPSPDPVEPKKKPLVSGKKKKKVVKRKKKN